MKMRSEQNENKKLCQKLLSQLTIAHAIPRINESLILKEFNFKAPVLDLGCGEGVFASSSLGKIDVGLDIDPKVVRIAKKSGVYKKVVVSSGDKMPFENSSFNTVVSNSVLEHIEDLDSIFKEVKRVLKNGGKFIFIVPDKTASDYFFYEDLFNKLGFKRIGKSYRNLKNKMFQYAHLENKKFWEDLTIRNGFKINKSIGFIPPKTVKLIDFLSPLALPDYLLRRVFGRSFILRPDFVNRILLFFIMPHISSKALNDKEATGWCFEVEKE